jgi:hypothetical protein
MEGVTQWPMPEGLKFGYWRDGWAFCPLTDRHDYPACKVPLTPERWERIPEEVQEKLFKLMVLHVPERERNEVEGIGFVDFEQWYSVECTNREELHKMVDEFDIGVLR